MISSRSAKLPALRKTSSRNLVSTSLHSRWCSSKVRRTARVHVEATDLDGNPISFDADDLLAVCVQHEIDHLDGKLFIDRISRLKRMMFESKLKKGTRQSQVK